MTKKRIIKSTSHRPKQEPSNSVTYQFRLEMLGTFYRNSSGIVYFLRRKPIVNNGHEPRILYLQNINDAHDTIFETNRIDWELTTKP